MSCTIGMENLRAGPYYLEKGDPIEANILATNEWGDSALSGWHSGPVVRTEPTDGPTPSRDLSAPTSTEIKIYWPIILAEDNGGT